MTDIIIFMWDTFSWPRALLERYLDYTFRPRARLPVMFNVLLSNCKYITVYMEMLVILHVLITSIICSQPFYIHYFAYVFMYILFHIKNRKYRIGFKIAQLAQYILWKKMFAIGISIKDVNLISKSRRTY